MPPRTNTSILPGAFETAAGADVAPPGGAPIERGERVVRAELGTTLLAIALGGLIAAAVAALVAYPLMRL